MIPQIAKYDSASNWLQSEWAGDDQFNSLRRKTRTQARGCIAPATALGAVCRQLHGIGRKPTKQTFLILCAIAHRRTDHLFVRFYPTDVGDRG